MKRRLLVAKAMVHSPPIPGAGRTHPPGSMSICAGSLWELVSELNRDGVTGGAHHPLSRRGRRAVRSHRDHQPTGQLIANKPTRELVDMAREKVVEVTVADAPPRPAPAHPAFVRVEWDGAARGGEVTYDKDRMSAGQVLGILQEQGLTIDDVTTREADLEDVFVQLTATGIGAGAG